MGEVGAYLSTIDGPDRGALQRVIAIALDVVPEAQEGTSYAMPALLYRDKGLLATVRTKEFLSLYPYSGAVVASVLEALSDFETTTGSIHYSVDHQLPDALVRRIVEARRAEIDAKAR
ncbi:MAG: iron chaperone [Cellulomonas sp.]